ncbi:malonyl-ACP O-methyltransferase BioC [Legionella sp. D16C41]|uniref:malonyl-ACP O-methyltransferase BioC n=1 Tax=Legionella sp. D16C41 TaxID=3402688 RepID=UPI003AF81205
MNPKTEICNAFNQHAVHYQQAAKVQTEIGNRLFERLDYLKIQPRFILDLGCGPAIFSLLLKKKYPKAVIIGLDIAYEMLLQARQKQTFWRKWLLINADMMTLPFVDGVFDLIFANQVIHWNATLAPLFRELNRVMAPNGCFMFSTLGPDTFKELKQAWALVNNYAHTNNFIDMHDIGDCLLNERFLDPVVDMEYLTVHYNDLGELTSSLKAQGVRNINLHRNQGLTAKGHWQAFEKNYQKLLTIDGKYPLTYEVIYGHAWKGEQRRLETGIETFIPISKIGKRTS